jgi:hypothetical protein
MSIPSPFDAAEVWDTLVLGGARFRGTFEWGGDLIKRKLDRRHAAGRDGARVRDKGYDLAELDLTLTVTNSEEWADLQALIALVFPRAASPGSRNALTCTPPTLALAGVSKLYGTSMGPLAQASPTKWTVTIKMVEFRDPPAGAANVSRTPRPAPDIGANRTAFTGTEQAPPPTPPPTPGPAAP